MKSFEYDAIVVGSGPNGLSAAVSLAGAGKKVLVCEAAATYGGGTRSAEITMPGFRHDLCSAVHPMAVVSPFFSSLRLEEHGLRWIYPGVQMAHPLGDGSCVELHTSIEETAAGLAEDAGAYRSLFEPLNKNRAKIFDGLLRPLLSVPRHPLLMALFGYKAILPATTFAETFFKGERARSLFIGTAAHANCPLDRPGAAGIGLSLLLAAHAQGWPVAAGGSQCLADALLSLLRERGGEIRLNAPVRSLADLPSARWHFFDLSPVNVAKLLADELPPRLRRNLENFKHGPGIFKLDWALRAPIPWLLESCRAAGTVHLGGTSQEIIASEKLPTEGAVGEAPYVLLTQPSLFDRSRAPEGFHTAWAYCHAPAGSREDLSERIERQIEKQAPGFGELVLQRTLTDSADLESRNANLIGGDISGGEFSLGGVLFAHRPGLNPYILSRERRYFLCSASTPPGPGVHGMCGFNAAQAALSLPD